MSASEKILLVDDEQNVLDGYRRTLRKNFKLQTALSGALGLEVLQNEGPFAAVVSDMKMPEMEGAEFLSHVKKRHPDTVRIMLTGNADQATAISAINDADVFRFLNKPCPAEEMIDVLGSAMDKYRKDTIEKRLLQETLNGAIKALLDILSITYPELFGHTDSIAKLAEKCAEKLAVSTNWELETSARLSLVGMVVLPQHIVNKVVVGESLSEDEKQIHQRFPESGARLIENIPRMKSVANNVRHVLTRYDGTDTSGLSGADIPIIARILAPILSYQTKINAGTEPDVAMSKLRATQGIFDPQVIEALCAIVDGESEREIIEVSVYRLGTNMYLADDLLASNGAMLVTKNQKISQSLADRLINFSENRTIDSKILVYIEGHSAPFN